MESKNAKKYTEKAYDDFKRVGIPIAQEVTARIEKAVELAEEEMREKAIKFLCNLYCEDIVEETYNCFLKKPCTSMEVFINALNN